MSRKSWWARRASMRISTLRRSKLDPVPEDSVLTKVLERL
jgi:hypothetical protein